jgi:hypothetical protein
MWKLDIHSHADNFPSISRLLPINTDMIASQNTIIFIIVKSDYLVDLLVNTPIPRSNTTKSMECNIYCLPLKDVFAVVLTGILRGIIGFTANDISAGSTLGK